MSKVQPITTEAWRREEEVLLLCRLIAVYEIDSMEHRPGTVQGDRARVRASLLRGWL